MDIKLNKIGEKANLYEIEGRKATGLRPSFIYAEGYDGWVAAEKLSSNLGGELF